jgi:hypothetical protein
MRSLFPLRSISTSAPMLASNALVSASRCFED